MKKYLVLGLLVSLWAVATAADPTGLRTWKATTGHSLKAKALKVEAGQVSFQREDGSTLDVPLEKLIEADREFLSQHFGIGTDAPAGEVPGPGAGAPADDLGFPLGETTQELDCGDGAHCFFYLPNSLQQGKEHPVLFIMNPGGGSAGTAKRYTEGAERNRWILAVSKESKNGNKGSGDAILAMMKFAREKLPVDEKRLYVTGFSGGSRMAYWASQEEKKIAGVIACGAGGSIGGSKQVVYGLCGTNCFNRNDMASSFKKVSHKGAILRYFEGKHAWANSELCDDAITHLNGVFLAANQRKYPDEYRHYVHQVGELIKAATADGNTERAYMWADTMERLKMDHPEAAKALASLGDDEANTLFVKGLYGIRKFAEKHFGKGSGSQWKADPKVASACKSEARKYAGSYWETILQRMAEDAQKF